MFWRWVRQIFFHPNWKLALKCPSVGHDGFSKLSGCSASNRILCVPLQLAAIDQKESLGAVGGNWYPPQLVQDVQILQIRGFGEPTCVLLSVFGGFLKLILVPVLFAWFSVCAAQTPHSKVLASITMRDSSAIEVNYQIPPSCTGLSFSNDGIAPEVAVALRKDWTPADQCTIVDSAQVRPAHAACTVLRVRVPASRLSLDRIYPWAFPLEQGLYVHTMSYAVAETCGPIDWLFSSPGGSVVADGVFSAESSTRLAATGGGNYMPVVLFRKPNNNGRIYVDSGFTQQGAEFVRETISTVERTLRAMLPDLQFTMPYTLATAAPDGEVWGDVANHTVMRLHLAASPQPEQRVHMRGFLAHELAHLIHAKSGKWNAPWELEQSLIDEGGAEFLRWAVTARTAWAEPTELRQYLERAVNSCVLTAAGRRWRDIANRGFGTAPYDCGLTFHVLGLAGGNSVDPPLLRLRDHYRMAKLGHSTDFAQALECGDSKSCSSRWLKRIGGSESVEAVLLDYTFQSGAVFGRGNWTTEMMDLARRRYMNRLMQLDCDGLVRISHKADFVRVGPGLKCGALREGMEIVRIEGVALFGDVQGLQSSARACADRGRTVLGLKSGREVVVVCDKSAYVPMQQFSVDLDLALALTR